MTQMMTHTLQKIKVLRFQMTEEGIPQG